MNEPVDTTSSPPTANAEAEHPPRSPMDRAAVDALIASIRNVEREDPPEPIITVGDSLAALVRAFAGLKDWRGVLGLNQFTQRIVFRKEAPFGDVVRLGNVFDEDDSARVRLWFEDTFGEEISKRNVFDAVSIVASRNSFHPVREYLSDLPWDGTPRIDTWLEDLCGVQPDSDDHRRLVRAVSRKWLVSCVARAMKPGCKVDTMLILEGKQGIGKSAALSALAGSDFFRDSLIDFRTKDACQMIQGAWIYELPELDAVLRAETSSTKAFLTRPIDTFRAPYARIPISVPRSVVFCGTINHGGYLKDHTGNRRFWVVRCGDVIDVEGIHAHRDQLWAEARTIFESGESWHLSRDEERLMGAQHEERIEVDPWEETITAWIAKHGSAPFAAEEVLDGALGIRAASRNPNVTRRVHHILEGLGFERQRRAFDKGCGRVYRYVRVESVAPRPADPLPHCEPSEVAATATGVAA